MHLCKALRQLERERHASPKEAVLPHRLSTVLALTNDPQLFSGGAPSLPINLAKKRGHKSQQPCNTRCSSSTRDPSYQRGGNRRKWEIPWKNVTARGSASVRGCREPTVRTRHAKRPAR